MSTLPDKWAVEITSPQDAERLQALFPEGCDSLGVTFKDTYKRCNQDGILYFAKHPKFTPYWGYIINKANFNGYTIYTITELETLLNK